MAASSSTQPEGAAPAPRRTTTPIEDWQPPEGSLREAVSRGRDFARFTELQTALKKSCTALWHFTQRDFVALEQVAPQHAKLCKELSKLDASRFLKLPADFETLARRMEEREKLQIVFIGPVNAGKTTLVNQLLTSHLEELLPTNVLAETCRIWKITSSDGSSMIVSVDGHEKKSFDCDHVEEAAVGVTKLRELSEYLAEYLNREATATECDVVTGEITIVIPLKVLNPFGCQYCLVDTPGYTESDAHGALVSKYLHDHSHIVCMACSLTQGKAVVQTTKGMLSSCSDRTFWVLTHCDGVMDKCKRKQTLRDVVDKAKQAFCKEVNNLNASTQVFKHAAKALTPPGPEQQEWSRALQKHLPRQEAAKWLEDIRMHIKSCFVEIQQQNHVLCSQSRHCVDRATDVLSAYTQRRDSSTGAAAAIECFGKDLQCGVEDDLVKQMQQGVEMVKGSILEELCKQAAQALQARGRWMFDSQQSYFEDLVKELTPMLQEKLQSKLDEVEQAAHARVLEKAGQLTEAARERSKSGGRAINTPHANHLQSRYPVESVVSLSLAAGGAGCATFTTSGAAVLTALELSSPVVPVVGAVVAVAVGSIAVLGLSVKKAGELNPFWTKASTEADVISKIRELNQWGTLAEVSSARAYARLQDSIVQLRCSFSKQLLLQNVPRKALDELFPDLSLFEKLQQDISTLNGDVQAFAASPDLAASASGRLRECRLSACREAWNHVMDLTCIYVGANVRTDSVQGELLAGLLHQRCHAAVMSDMFSEARRTAEVFKEIFPGLLLPALYCTATSLQIEFLRGTLDESIIVADVRSCLERLDSQHAEREVPRELEIWFLAVVASLPFGQKGFQQLSPFGEQSQQRLLSATTCLLAEQMKDPPLIQNVVVEVAASMRVEATRRSQHEPPCSALEHLARLSSGEGCQTPQDPCAQDAHERVQRVFDEKRSSYATGVVNSVHLLLASLPPSHINMETVGRSLVSAVLEQISQQFASGPAAVRAVEKEIRSELCPGDQGFVPLCDEWVRVFGEALKL